MFDLNVDFDLQVPGHVSPDQVYVIIEDTHAFVESHMESWNELDEDSPVVGDEILKFCEDNNYDVDLVQQIIEQIAYALSKLVASNDLLKPTVVH
jgi:hypothetical protein